MNSKILTAIFLVVCAMCAYFFILLQNLFDMGEPVNYANIKFTTSQVIDLKVGTGQGIVKKSKFVFQHSTWIYDPNLEDFKGKSLGESYTRSAAITASFGDGTFMPKWEKMISDIKVGGIKRLILSPKSLDQKQKLLFMFPKEHWVMLDIELIEIKK